MAISYLNAQPAFVAGEGSGGTEVTSGGYKYHTFTSSGTFTVNAPGTFEVLVVGGGGQGQIANLAGGGGGGAGAVKNATIYLDVGSTTVTIGAGGSGAGANGNFGNPTTIGPVFAAGGGAAISISTLSGVGACGAGMYGDNSAVTAGDNAFDGNKGGNAVGSTVNDNNRAGGGGGGQGAAGGNATTAVGGVGGAGTNTYATWHTATSTGVSDYIAGGGGGSSPSSGSALGGSGGGGNAANGGGGGSGTANTGSGGGANSDTSNGGNGGSGLVIIRYAV